MSAALEFLKKLYPSGPWVLVAIHPDDGSIETRGFGPESADKAEAWIAGWSGTRNLYFSINKPLDPSRRATKEKMASVHFVHCDIDYRAGEDLASEKERIRALLTERLPEGVHPPTAVWFSGGGYWCCWRLAVEIPIAGDMDAAERVESRNRWLATALDGDDKCCDISRIARLPGTMNLPNKKKIARGRVPAEAELLFFDESRRYTLAKFPSQAPIGDDLQGERGGEKPSGEKRGGGGRPRDTKVEVPADRDVPRLGDLSELDEYDGIPERVLVAIEHGRDAANPKPKDDSRSAWLIDAVCALLRAGVPDDLVYGIITDEQWLISESVLELKGRERRKYALRQIEQGHKLIKEEERKSDGRVWIQVRGCELSQIVDTAERELLKGDWQIYTRGEMLARVTVLEDAEGNPDPKSGEVHRPAGSVVLKQVTSTWLREQMGRACGWLVWDKDLNDWRRADPPPVYATTYLARVGEWRARPLIGVVQAPTLRADGSLLQAQGYDEASRLLLHSGGARFPEILETPTREQALAAIELLEQPFRKFPFVTEADRSVVTAAILTGLVRRSLPAAPHFPIDASTAGTGKSLVVDCIGILVVGQAPAHMAQGKEVAEDEKRLSTCLMAGDAIISIDNCERPIEGDFLCSMATQEMVQARILGLSERVRLPTQVLVMMSGNNIAVVGDMTRRVLVCRLDAGVENPEEREFDFCPREMCRERRPELVAAGLTILRAYLAAGRPHRAQVPPLGSFEAWNYIREAICWLGRADPALTRTRAKADDPRRSELVELLEAWQEVAGSCDLTLHQLRAKISGNVESDDSPSARLGEMLRALGGDPRELNLRKVGWRLRGMKDRVAGGRVLRCSDGNGRQLWRVDSVEPKQPI